MHDGFPIIRLELQGMKHSILKAFSESNAEIEKAVEAALAQTITPENVKKIVAGHIEREANNVLASLVNDAMTRVLWDDTLKNELARLVGRSVSRKIRAAYPAFKPTRARGRK